ncbi:hypothetical protein MCOR02_008460 [Pyricularia oryzae]|uniref:Transcription factor domain-containing protein n=1 Tax=Pyricularia grisea TaxID=148305 RepID=A0ABQ8NVM5_PYRGI|nr:hypothetical protein MCOR01_004473 [Pyricularia oryzae]KAI6302741.1 hypothetical protein MCOR33_002010 [Pyricularia grisea]KAH9431154.1 hypothetical protein MCOR02_008460 [Pyricularia oryzae]KAI6253351.1 hypothetical protein MCOR19_010078 [Pyricularia oryzae]KAI6312540.1 hypothetical protein MCOR34_005546 [Pyricularia oryzae]
MHSQSAPQEKGPTKQSLEQDVAALFPVPDPAGVTEPGDGPVSPWPQPREYGARGDRLSRLASMELIEQVLNDWFEKLHPLAPLLHRRHFMWRLRQGEASSNNPAGKIFCALVASTCAVTASSLRCWAGSINARRCLAFIDELELLHRRPASGAGGDAFEYTLDWCIAMYNVGMALFSLSANTTYTPDVHGALSQAAEGVRYILRYRMSDTSFADQQLLKRLLWLLFCTSNILDSRGHLSYLVIGHHDDLTSLRPQDLNDLSLSVGLYQQLSVDDLSPWHGDQISYIPALLGLADLFMVWHRAQNAVMRSDDESQACLATCLADVQSVMESLPPELCWRGAATMPARVTMGHDAQVANLIVTSLYIRSDLLQKFPPTDDAGRRRHYQEHDRVIDGLIDVMWNVPDSVLEHDGRHVIPKLRECAAAYGKYLNLELDGMKVYPAGKAKLELLLKKLDIIDCWPGPARSEHHGIGGDRLLSEGAGVFFGHDLLWNDLRIGPLTRVE